MSIELNGPAPENLTSTSNVDTKISEVDQKIQKITKSIFYRFFGFGNKNLQTHIGELKTIAYTSLPTSTDQTISAKKIQEAIAPILKSSNKTTLTAAKDLNYSLNLVKEGFSLANILDSSFATQYDQKPNYRFHLKLKGKTLDLQGAGLNEHGQLKAKGAFGRVFFGKDPNTGKEIAVKVVKKQPNETMDNLKREAGFLLKMQGSNHVLGSSNVAFQGDYMFVVMDKIDGSELSEILKNNPSLTVKEKISILLDIAKGLQELHTKGIIHKDLKPENILIDEKTKKATIIDLGLARTIQEKTTEYSGTPNYMAPEAFLRKEQTPATDIYSMGLLMHQVFTKELFRIPERETDKRLTQNLSVSHAMTSYAYNQKLMKLIEDCLKAAPESRSSIDKLIKDLQNSHDSIR